MDTKNDLWEYIKMKYDIPDIAKRWALERIQEAWRKHRSDLKVDSYDPYPNDEIRMINKPDDIPECQFKELLIYWESEKFKEKEKRIVSLTDMFVATRVRKANHSYKASNEDTTTKIVQME